VKKPLGETMQSCGLTRNCVLIRKLETTLVTLLAQFRF
jgi:hypothetical protein